MILKKEDAAMKMPYEQVKERVRREKDALGGLVLGTGVLMLVGILAAIFLGR